MIKGLEKSKELSDDQLQKSGKSEQISDVVPKVTTIDVPRLMLQIRKQIEAEINKEAGVGTEGCSRSVSSEIPKWQSEQILEFTGGSGDEAGSRAGQLRFSEDLRTLNERYARALGVDPLSVSTHRKGVIGRIIVAVKRRIRSLVWDLLKDHFASEREFQGALIRYLNLVSSYVDTRDARNFWELVRKIDVDVVKALDRVERFDSDTTASLQQLENRLQALISKNLGEILQSVAEIKANAATETVVIRGLEGIISRLARADRTPSECATEEQLNPTSVTTDYSYLLLENRFRGSEEQIAERVADYIPLLLSGNGHIVTNSIVEIGSGRGEFLTLMKEHGIASYGVDCDMAMVELCREKGLTVFHQDGLAHLEAVPLKSIGGVVAIQVVEHMARQSLEYFLSLCASRVVSGGIVILETINPRSLLALSSNYFRDPTHQWPLHPDTLRYQAELAGLVVNEIRYRSAVPESARLPKIPLNEFLMPSEVGIVSGINKIVSQLNELLYGYQDYALIAKAP